MTDWLSMAIAPRDGSKVILLTEDYSAVYGAWWESDRKCWDEWSGDVLGYDRDFAGWIAAPKTPDPIEIVRTSEPE